MRVRNQVNEGHGPRINPFRDQLFANVNSTSPCCFANSRAERTATTLPRSVRYGSLTDHRVQIRDVRFSPESGHAERLRPLSAISGRPRPRLA
jgi:hypothetical protein